MTTVGYDANQSVAQGTYKIVEDTIKRKDGTYSLRQGSKFDEEFMIVNFKPNTNPNDVYEELELYHTFGEKGISPRIWYVKLPTGEQVSLTIFLKRFNSGHVMPESYLVEKGNCDNGVLQHYLGNYPQLLIDLHKFLTEKVVSNGLVNTDIKIPNLCIGKDGKFRMIDLDPNFLKPIQLTNILPTDYVNYMVFQVYINLKHSFGINIDIRTIFSQNDLQQMFVNLYNFNDNKFHPLNMLLWYSGKHNEFYSAGGFRNYSPKNLYENIFQTLQISVQPVPTPSPAVLKTPGLYAQLFWGIKDGLSKLSRILRFARGKKKSKRRGLRVLKKPKNKTKSKGKKTLSKTL